MADSVIILYIEVVVLIGFLPFYFYVDIPRIIHTCIRSTAHTLTTYFIYRIIRARSKEVRGWKYLLRSETWEKMSGCIGINR